MDQWWSWILTAVGLTGFILAGRKVWWSWYVNIACQALWYAYAIVTEQWGFIVAATAYTVVFSQNAYKWTKEHQEKRRIVTELRKPHLLQICPPEDVDFIMRLHEAEQERPTHTFTLNLLEFDRQDHLEDAIKAESDRWLASLPESLQWRGVSVYMESPPQNPHIKKFTLEVNR